MWEGFVSRKNIDVNEEKLLSGSVDTLEGTEILNFLRGTEDQCLEFCEEMEQLIHGDFEILGKIGFRDESTFS